jgi:hypothetical protein
MKASLLGILLLAGAMANTPVRAANYDLDPSIRATWPNLNSGSNEVPDAAVVGSRAYILNGGKLNIVDVSSPEQLGLIGSLDLSGGVRIDVKNNLAGVALGDAGVVFIDVSDPQAPRELSRLPLSGNNFAVTIDGTRAYVSGQDTGLHVIDISDPTEPKLLGTADTPRIAAYTSVYGNIAYVSAVQDGLDMIDVSDPANMHSVGGWANFTGLVRSTVIRGTNMFMATDGGLQIFNLRADGKPSLIADDHTITSYVGVFGDTAYVAGVGLRLVDVSNPADPQTKITTELIKGRVVGVSGTFVYVLNGTFQIAEFIANPQRMTRFPNIGDASDITVKGKYAYLSGKASGLHIVDISNSADLQPVAQQTEPADTAEIRGNRAYVVGATGFRIIDITNPANPQTIGAIAGQPMLDVSVAGKQAYTIIAGDSGNSLAAIDCSDPSEPRIVWTRPCLGSALAVKDGFAYVTEYGIRVFDLSDPLEPKEVGLLNSIGTGLSNDITVRGQYVYLAANYSGFVIIDVSDPTQPFVAGRSNVGTIPFVRLSLSGNYAYLADGSGGLHVFNIEDVTHPDRVGGNVHVNASGLFASGDTLYVGERTGGVTITDLYRKDPGAIHLTGLEPIVDGVARLRAKGPIGATVQLQKLENGTWKPLQPITTDASPIDITDPNASGDIQLYRIAAP